MLYGLLVTLFIILCFLLILMVLLQKGKSSLGMGAFGGGSQMLFGASGGQDLFQKITWGMGALLMLGSLALALMKSSSLQTSRYLSNRPVAPFEQQMPAPQTQHAATPVTQEAPTTTPAPESAAQ